MRGAKAMRNEGFDLGCTDSHLEGTVKKPKLYQGYSQNKTSSEKTEGEKYSRKFCLRGRDVTLVEWHIWHIWHIW